jgi:glutathione S-transferase
MILYHCVSARSFRPLWALEELGLRYDLRMLPFPPRSRRKDFLDINPLGTIPAFIDGEIRMTESAAICQYLAARHGRGTLEVGCDEGDFGAYLNWLHFGEATLTFPQTIVLRYGRFELPERRLPQAVEDYTRWFLSRLKAISPVVSSRPYLCAERFTAADISVGYALMLAEHLKLEDRFPAGVAEYWQRLRGRTGFTRALASQGRAALEQGVSTRPAPNEEP